MDKTDEMMIVANLKIIAAQAQVLALELENNKLWPGDLEQKFGVIQRASRDISANITKQR